MMSSNATPQMSRNPKHKLKNQLAIILGFADLLMQEMAADDARRADAEEIYAAAQRATALLKTVSISATADIV